jgi:hypothetical protein
VEFDVKPVSIGWAAEVSLGLFDSDMTRLSPCQVALLFARGDTGNRMVLQWSTNSGSDQLGFPNQFVPDQWYHGLLELDPSVGTLYGRVTRVSDGVLIAEQTGTGLGSLTGIDRLGISEVGHPYASGATAYGYIDNVVVSQTSEPAPVPEPVTLASGAIGLACVGAYLRRRGKIATRPV